MSTLLAFDNDGVLRDESGSYLRCVAETVTFFSRGVKPTDEELTESLIQSNNDWERTYSILQNREINVDFEAVKIYFQDLYLGEEGNYTGYINDEPWLANNDLLKTLAEAYPLVIVSGAPLDEITYTLRRNGAFDFFSGIWGMYECNGKNDGIEQAIARFSSTKVLFCDDRPSGIKDALKVAHTHKIDVFGVMPPNPSPDWSNVLKDAGAKGIYQNVNEYCRDIVNLV